MQRQSLTVQHLGSNGFKNQLARFCCETALSHAKTPSSPRNTSETFALFAPLRKTFPRFATRTSSATEHTRHKARKEGGQSTSKESGYV